MSNGRGCSRKKINIKSVQLDLRKQQLNPHSGGTTLCCGITLGVSKGDMVSLSKLLPQGDPGDGTQ